MQCSACGRAETVSHAGLEWAMGRRLCLTRNVCRVDHVDRAISDMHSFCALVADFSMTQWVHALTGGSDDWRCPQRVACPLKKYLSPSAHLLRQENRSAEVVGGQWELAVLMLACWAACTEDAGSAIVFRDDEALYPCPVCNRLVSHAAQVEEGSGLLYCRGAFCWGADQPFSMLHYISKSVFNQACNTARRFAGGVRGYPLLRGLRTRLQLPVLHCTGNLSKMVVLFILACLPEPVRATAKQTILAITSKGKVEALYLREYRELVASAAASPSVLSPDLDAVFRVMLQLVQLVNAAWRSSLTAKGASERAAASAITRLAASVLGPLFREVKPMDPETKDSKVVNLYLHAPIAHLHHQVGNYRSSVAYVSNDNMEGHIRAIGRYLYNNGNNASLAALLSDLVAMTNATVNFATPRSHPSSLVFTKFIRVCKCWATLGKDGPADYDALRTIAEQEADLVVTNDDTRESLSVRLPSHARVNVNGERRRDASGKPQLGKKEALRRGLRFSQHTISACFCGKLTGKDPSPVMDLLRKRQCAAAARSPRAAAFAASSARAANGAGMEPSDGDVQPDGEYETDAGSATDGGPASSADETMDDEPLGPGSARRQSKKRTGAELAAAMATVLPPPWLLAKVFDDTAMYAAAFHGSTASQASPSLEEMAACVRKHILVVRLLLMRTRTLSFAAWALSATVNKQELVEAAESVLRRLLVIRDSLLPADSLMPIS